MRIWDLHSTMSVFHHKCQFNATFIWHNNMAHIWVQKWQFNVYEIVALHKRLTYLDFEKISHLDGKRFEYEYFTAYAFLFNPIPTKQFYHLTKPSWNRVHLSTWILVPTLKIKTSLSFHNITYVTKKSGQAIILYHYCGLSRFFWNRR